MIVRWEDRDWDWRPEELTVGMARKIRDFTGRGLRSWDMGVSDGEADSLIALWWAIQHQNGVDVPIETIEATFTPTLFYRAMDDAARAELVRRAQQDAKPKGKGAKFSPKDGPTPRRTRTSAGTGTDTSFS